MSKQRGLDSKASGANASVRPVGHCENFIPTIKQTVLAWYFWLIVQ